MTGAEWVAIIGAIFAGLTMLVVQIILTINQNKGLAVAASKREDHGAQLTEIAKAVNASVVTPSTKPPPLPDQPFNDALKAEEKDHAHEK